MVLCFCTAVVPLHAGKLDLDIYAIDSPPAQAVDDPYRLPRYPVTPGDPRSLRGESRWVRYVSHAGYASLGVADLIASLATGGVAPAIGFGVIAVIHGLGLLGAVSAPRRPSKPPADGVKG